MTKRILVVEDNPINQVVTSRLLAALGYEPDIAGDGLAALEAIERAAYDVVLMDVRMPGLDGPGATRAIRDRWPMSGPRIIALTANASGADRQECIDAGMDDFLAKPVTLEELAAALRRWSQTCPGTTTPVS